jgi:transposase
MLLTDDERSKREAGVRRLKTAQRLALRSRIVLLAAGEASNAAIAAELKVTMPTVAKRRSRFLDDRLEGLTDEPRPGAPRSRTDSPVEEVIAKTLASKPENATPWSTRGMAEATGRSQTAIVRIGRAFERQPHRRETVKLSTDPFFVEKVRDVVGLDLNPPERALVLSVDEKSPVQALDRTQPILPLMSGQAERGTPDDVRNGTTALFAARNVATGQVIGKCYRRHRQQECLRFLETIDATIPEQEGVAVHRILDHYGTHKAPRVKRWRTRHPRFVVHFTPTRGSWRNQVERFFAEITEKKIRRGAYRSVRALEESIRDDRDHHNANPKPFVGTADADLILRRVEKVGKRISNSGH